MNVVTRFAPSPTGPLHLGHAFSAVRAEALARAAGGLFLLRIEDIDPGRARTGHVAGILADLAWLGLEPDAPPLFQSERIPAYRAALDRLEAMGLLYPCFCTRRAIAAEIAASASAPHGPDGPLYPGTCRRLPGAERARRAAGEPHALRLDMAAAVAAASVPIFWRDKEAGRVAAAPETFGDVVLARKDAPTSYHLAVTVDDADAGVTDVVRGRDLFAATHVHRLLQALLGLPVPLYHHHALLAGPDGARLAKRHGAPALADLRDGGMDGRRLAAALRGGRLPAGYSWAEA